jgi:hypothetical protein
MCSVGNGQHNKDAAAGASAFQREFAGIFAAGNFADRSFSVDPAGGRLTPRAYIAAGHCGHAGHGGS